VQDPGHAEDTSLGHGHDHTPVAWAGRVFGLARALAPVLVSR